MLTNVDALVAVDAEPEEECFLGVCDLQVLVAGYNFQCSGDGPAVGPVVLQPVALTCVYLEPEAGRNGNEVRDDCYQLRA